MELEKYFEFLSEYDIRIKGTRVGIEKYSCMNISINNVHQRKLLNIFLGLL
jgi:hypothetical protein